MYIKPQGTEVTLLDDTLQKTVGYTTGNCIINLSDKAIGVVGFFWDTIFLILKNVSVAIKLLIY